jgi:acyl-lipid omega-6 desaturase (Delta-12 desaturase)
VPYLGVWTLAWTLRPGAIAAVGLGLVATLFLARMYSLFHDLTHASLFASRKTNHIWGHALGFLLFTPYHAGSRTASTATRSYCC